MSAMWPTPSHDTQRTMWSPSSMTGTTPEPSTLNESPATTGTTSDRKKRPASRLTTNSTLSAVPSCTTAATKDPSAQSSAAATT